MLLHIIGKEVIPQSDMREAMPPFNVILITSKYAICQLILTSLASMSVPEDLHQTLICSMLPTLSGHDPKLCKQISSTIWCLLYKHWSVPI
mmetsp:Transcript_24686/g.43801  ORF Transcript_24686/g.43801 Transcript_24686/m.43801 type:complete len:91 (-) Transcript_24686:288-560(-)